MQTFPQRDRGDSPRHHRSSPILRIRTILLIVTLLIAGVGVFFLSGIPKAHSAALTSKAHSAATWTPIWREDFNGGAVTGPNLSNWVYDIGTGWGTGEIEYMSNSTQNVYQDGNGHLDITAIRDASGNWTSGRIESRRSDFAAPAGGQLQISASIQQPNVSGAAAAGYWPAFWILDTQYRRDHTWPSEGEVDTMEDINGLSSVFGTLHCGVDPGGPCHETDGISSGQKACPGCQTGFHTYSLIIDRSVSPEQIRWYLDGNNYYTVSANQVDATTWANAVDHSFYIILDLAMGGSFPNKFGGGPTAATQASASMIVDNVQVSTMGAKYYKVVNRNSGQVLDINGSGAAIQSPSNGGSSQEWEEVPSNNGYKLINVNSGLLLDDPGDATKQGTALEQWDDTYSSNEWWNLVSTGDGYYYLVNQSGSLYADVSGASTANGAPVIAWPLDKGKNQEWQLVAV